MKKTSKLLVQSIMAVTVAASLFTITGCGSEESKAKIGDIGSSDNGSDKANEIAYAGIGQYIEGDNWRISLLDAKTYSSISESGGFYTDKPEAGKEFLVLFLEAENISDEDDYFNYLNFKAYADDSHVKNTMIMNDVDGYDSVSGDVASGKKIKGYAVWEVNTGWSNFEVSYDDDVWSNKTTACFKISSGDIK